MPVRTKTHEALQKQHQELQSTHGHLASDLMTCQTQNTALMTQVETVTETNVALMTLVQECLVILTKVNTTRTGRAAIRKQIAGVLEEATKHGWYVASPVAVEVQDATE